MSKLRGRFAQRPKAGIKRRDSLLRAPQRVPIPRMSTGGRVATVKHEVPLLKGLDQLQREILGWNPREISKDKMSASGMKAFTNPYVKFKKVPVKFSGIREYQSVFFSLLLENFRASISQAWNGENILQKFQGRTIQTKTVNDLLELIVSLKPPNRPFSKPLTVTHGDILLLHLHPDARTEPKSESKSVHKKVLELGEISELKRVRDEHGYVALAVVQPFDARSCEREAFQRKLGKDLSRKFPQRSSGKPQAPPTHRILLYLSEKWGAQRALTLRKFLSVASSRTMSWFASKLNESVRTLYRQYLGLASVDRQPLWMPLKCARLKCKAEGNDGQKRVLSIPDIILKPLNKSQQKAIIDAVTGPEGFSLIQGPPGSGKTRTLVRLVNAFLLTNSKSGHRARVLVCAPSNGAIDEIVERLVREGFVDCNGSPIQNPKDWILRLGMPSRPNNRELMSVCIDSRIQDMYTTSDQCNKTPEVEKLKKAKRSAVQKLTKISAEISRIQASGSSAGGNLDGLNDELIRITKTIQEMRKRLVALKGKGGSNRRKRFSRKHLQMLRQELVNQASIVCATLSGSGMEVLRECRRSFDALIIDEAAQSTETEVLIPLMHGVSRCCLVGDPRQLPPTIISQKAKRLGYGRSLFQRLEEGGMKAFFLNTQYRMHPEISNIPCKLFYNSKLLDSPSVSTRLPPQNWGSIVPPAYVFFDLSSSRESIGRFVGSYKNVGEIKFVLALFRRLEKGLRVGRVNRKVDMGSGPAWLGQHVGIITPYQSQLRDLRNELNRLTSNSKLTRQDSVSSIDSNTSPVQEVEVNTLDGFQGREKDMIIFSCVRSGGKGIGFLRDRQRLNVALTRAKYALYIVGNAETLSMDLAWKALITQTRARGLMV
ncbi:hypothetical protein AAMO2058_001039900 [Amorphochlora amoebiformis]